MDRVSVSADHGWHFEYSQALRDAFFVMDPDDVHNCTEVLSNLGKSWDLEAKCNMEWVLRRVKRKVPEPEILYPVVKKVFDFYADKIDGKTGAPLFGEKARHEAANVLKLVEAGYASDPPGVQLYFEQGNFPGLLLPISC
jgi:hypothetical protein